MITNTLKGKILAFVIFSLGIATGSVGGYLYEARVHTATDTADASKRKITAIHEKISFYDYLGLNAEQRTQIDKILEETRSEYQKLAAQTRPQSTALREQSQSKIRGLLTDEQKKKYDEWRAKQLRFRGPQPPLPATTNTK